ncbi:MAG: isocitrate lyase/phosphoenolpyruvate mutase family protein [Hyphomonas sp.]|uniref:isocitrate lyase/phosphoenolpyruvate mutase family protein n=1 Tax=Hyphomonas sp. TaxID=87 RepID=UPI0034A0384D
MARLRAARVVSDGVLAGFWINARTDICLRAKPATHGAHITGVSARGAACAEAGASSFLVPGLRDSGLNREVCAASRLPVNVMAGPEAAESGALAAPGVRRISYGPFPWRAAMAMPASYAAAAGKPG